MDKPWLKRNPVRYARRVLLGLATGRGLLVDRVREHLAG